MQLTNTVALLTGAKRIGARVAEELAKRGAHIALAYGRSKQEAEETAARVKAHGVRAEIVQADLSTPDACTALVEHVVKTFGRIDILINMASVYKSTPLDDLTLAEWEASMTVDLRASFLCAKAAVPHMKRQGGGRIVNFSDWLAKSGRPRYPGYLTYYVAKAGVMALTEALALELAASNILVNAVAPGPILAPAETSDEEFKAVEAATPLGRWGGELEIAKAVLALIDTEFITGETIRVDGGRHVK
jgi:NAD(P)-dependent dehydrogenase (short-subunit alcohol dehydrogenase family)